MLIVCSITDNTASDKRFKSLKAAIKAIPTVPNGAIMRECHHCYAIHDTHLTACPICKTVQKKFD